MPYELECSPEVIARLPSILDEIGCEVVTLREVEFEEERITWTLLSCSTRNANALVGIATLQGRVYRFANISMNLKRLLAFWHWRGDFLLAREIARAVKSAGGIEMPE